MHLKRFEPRVLDYLDAVEVEQSSATHRDSPKVAIVAQHSQQEQVSLSVSRLLEEFLGHGFRVVVASSSPTPSPLVFPHSIEPEITVLRKPNIGYDFGSWSIGLEWDASISRRDQVVLANDSMLGPFWSMDRIFDAFDETPADVFGLTETQQFGYHLQSYWVGYRGGILADPPLRGFWRSLRHEPNKERVIHRSEIGLSRLLRREGYVLSAAFPWEMSVVQGDNPTIKGWRQLLDLGYPFVKRQVIREPQVAPNGETVPAVLLDEFGIDVKEWL